MANWFLATKHSVRNLWEQSDRTVLRVHIITDAQSQLVTKEYNASLSNAQPVNLTATGRPAAWNQNIVIHIGFHIEHTFYWFEYQCKHRMLGEHEKNLKRMCDFSQARGEWFTNFPCVLPNIPCAVYCQMN